MNIVFMGTPEFSVPTLKKLIENHSVKAVITQPDRPRGRGKKIVFSPVKEVALEYKLPVFQPVKIKNDQEVIDKIKAIQPDFIIVVAFGQILTKEILDIPKYACINLHASLLPKYRGAAPINWSIINGEKVTGNTTMLMDVGIDTGDMLLKKEVKITEAMNYGELHDILMLEGANLLLETIDKYSKGTISPQKQEGATIYASMLTKEMGKIDWTKSNVEIVNLIRGLYPLMSAFTELEDTQMKIQKAKALNDEANDTPGQIESVTAEGIKVSTGSKCVLIQTIQFPGKKAMAVSEYLRGNSIKEGIVLV